MNKITNLIGSKRYQRSIDVDTNIQTQLEEKTKPLTEYDIIDIVNLQKVFDGERQKRKIYRFNGKLNIYTSNALSTGATSMMWDPLQTISASVVVPNNWLMQLTYPSEMDFNYTINANGITSNAFRGLQYTSLGSVIDSITGLTINGIQKHNMEVGDFVYIYNNTINPYQGIHTINSLGIDNVDTSKSLTLDKIIDTTIPFGSGNFIKIVEPSANDIKFDSPSDIFSIVSSDISGNTVTSFGPNVTAYLTVTTNVSHQLVINDFIDIRSYSTLTELNGMWRIYNVIGGSGSTRFVIRSGSGILYNPLKTPTNIKFRRMDGTPSEYYVRKFEVLTTNDYDVDKCSFSTNTYSDINDTTIGIANDTWSYQFNKDINIENLKDNRNATLSEIYFTMIKRAGKNPFDWSNVFADWDFNYKVQTLVPNLETISNKNTSGVGTVEKSSARSETLDSNDELQIVKGSMYFGDFIDYNSKEIKERTIAEVIHLFGNHGDTTTTERYYYKPFKKIKLRVYSETIETAGPNEVMVDIPDNYVTYADGSIAWRDLLTIGYMEGGINGVEYPFVNGSHYIYTNNNLYVRRQIPPNPIDQNGAKFSLNINEKC